MRNAGKAEAAPRRNGMGVSELEPRLRVSTDRVDHFYGEGTLKKQVLYDVSTNIMPGEIVLLTDPPVPAGPRC
jgi:hypothetical protein